jgi:serine/threonine protein phosphatase PrpC
MFVIESAGLSDTGKKRKDNQDTLLVDDGLGLYIVADGMGGHRAGEVASRLVVESLRGHIQRCRDGKAEVETEPADTTLSAEANRVRTGILLSNRVVHDAANGSKEYRGMGTTVAALFFDDRTLVAANVGDSPIFLVHKGRLERLSVPHTVVAESEAANLFGLEQLGAEFSHVLTRAMGVKETVEANICEVPCFTGDILVICSDGLTDMVSTEEILASVTRLSPEESCRELVDLANDRGGTDNVSVIVLRIKKNTNGEGRMKGFLSRFSDGFSSLGSKKKTAH